MERADAWIGLEPLEPRWLLSATAMEVGVNDFRVSETGTDISFQRGIAADVAYNSTDNEFLVVWQSDELGGGEDEIYGRLIDGETGSLGPIFRISQTGDDGVGTLDEAFKPAVAYNPTDNQYLVAWQADPATGIMADGELEIYGQILAADGTEIGGDFRISQVGNDGDANTDATDAAVAYNATDNEYLVVWSGDDSFDNAFEVYGQRVTAAGAQIGTDDFRISTMGVNDNDASRGAFRPDVVHNAVANEYLVVWEGNDTGELEIFVQRLEGETGNETGGDDLRISSMGPDGNASFAARSPAVAFDDAMDRYLVVWTGEDDAAGAGDEVFGQLLEGANAAMILPDDFRLSTVGLDTDGGADAADADVVYNALADEYLVVWHADPATGGLADGEFEIFGQRLDPDGGEIGDNDFRLSDMGPDGTRNYAATFPAVAFNPTDSEYLVVWQGDDNTPPLTDNKLEVFGQRIAVTVPNTPPTVDDQAFDVAEDAAVDDAVGAIVATDGETPSDLTYTVTGGSGAGLLVVDPDTGAITVAAALDHETAETLTLELEVTDPGSLSDTATITVSVLDVNEPPTGLTLSNDEIDEGTDTSGGFSVGVLAAVGDPDTGAFAVHSFSVIGGADAALFSIGGTNDDELILTAGILDRDTRATYTVDVEVTDGPNTLTQTFVIEVLDRPETVYVDDDWAALADGEDPDGAGPAAAIGFDAFATLQAAIDAVLGGGAVHVEPGSYAGVTVGKDVELVPVSGGVMIGGASPALTVSSGDVVVQSGVTFDQTGPDATVLVESGGSLTLIGSTVNESSDADAAAVHVEPGGALDLSSGDNTLNVVGVGSLLEWLDAAALDLTTTTLTLDAAAFADGFAVEDAIGHAMDDPAVGLVTWQAGARFVTPDTLGVQRAIDLAAAGHTVSVAPGTYTEDLVIDKADLELAGADRDTTTLRGVAFNDQAVFPLATPNINVLAAGVRLHGFTIESPDVPAGSYASGVVIDSPDVEIFDNRFVSRQGDAAPSGAHDSRTNVIIQTWAGSNSGKASRLDGLHIHDNSFTGDGKGYYGVFVNPQAEPIDADPAAAVRIENNAFTGNVWRAIEVERGHAVVADNTIAPSAETLHAWGGSGVSVRDFAGGAIDDVQITGNTVMGADAALGQGFAHGLLLGFADDTLSGVTVSGNSLTDHAEGVRVLRGDDTVELVDNAYAGSLIGVAVAGGSPTIRETASISGVGTGVAVTGGGPTVTQSTITDSDRGVLVGPGAAAVILDSTITGHGVAGVEIDGGAALLEGNDLGANTIGVLLRNDAVADLGDPTASDVTGLGAGTGPNGSSVGLNDFSSYQVPATDTAGAIVNRSDDSALSPDEAGRQGAPPDVPAVGNLWADPSPAGIESVIWHDRDDAALGFVDFAPFAGLSLGFTEDTIDEGDTAELTIGFANVPQPHTLTIDWADGTIDTVNLSAGQTQHTIQHTYADDPPAGVTYSVNVTVTEELTGETLSDAAAITVANVTPKLSLGGDAFVVEGTTYELDLGAIVDPGDDAVTQVIVRWGDGLEQAIDPSVTTLATTLAHVYDDGPAAVTIGVTLVDEDGAHVSAATLKVSVTNVAPTATLFHAGPVNEGSTGTVGFTSIADPSAADADVGFTFSYDFNNDGDFTDPGELQNVSDATVTVPAAYLADGDDPGPPTDRTVRARVVDKDGGFTEYTTTIDILSVAPRVFLNGAAPTVGTGETFSLTGFFTDPGDDAWSATVDFDDGDGPQPLSLDGKSFTLEHAYAAPGLYDVTVEVVDADDQLSGSRTITVEVVEQTFRVAELVPDASGFAVRFNRTPDVSVLNLYDGLDASTDATDVMVSGPGGSAVPGSLMWDEAAGLLRFVATGGPLDPGSYGVTLVSGADALRDLGGDVLDGDADGVAGDDFVTDFTVTPVTASLHIPDIARGPGQALDLDPTDPGSGLPITLTTADGATAIDFDLRFDPALLDLNGIAPADALPDDWSLTTNGLSPGHVRIAAWGTTPLSGTGLTLATLDASVPTDAPYGSAHALRLEAVQLNEGGITAARDAAVHHVGFLGDADGDGQYGGFDASLISRVVVTLDTGFDAFDRIDPRIVADATADGSLSALDASFVAEKAALLPRPQIPDPTPLPANGVSEASAGPTLSVPADLHGCVYGYVTVPVTLDTTDSDPVHAATVRLTYVPDDYETLTSYVSAGSFWDPADGWAFVANLVEPGDLRIVLYRATPSDPGRGTIAEVTFHSVGGLAPGLTPIGLEAVHPGEGGLSWSAANGGIDVAIPGDYEEDGDVDGFDLGVWQSGFGIAANALHTQGDGDCDGDVDAFDLGIWQANFGFGVEPAAAPATAVSASTPPVTRSNAEARNTSGGDHARRHRRLLAFALWQRAQRASHADEGPLTRTAVDADEHALFLNPARSNP